MQIDEAWRNRREGRISREQQEESLRRSDAADARRDAARGYKKKKKQRPRNLTYKCLDQECLTSFSKMGRAIEHCRETGHGGKRSEKEVMQLLSSEAKSLEDEKERKIQMGVSVMEEEKRNRMVEDNKGKNSGIRDEEKEVGDRRERERDDKKGEDYWKSKRMVHDGRDEGNGRRREDRRREERSEGSYGKNGWWVPSRKNTGENVVRGQEVVKRKREREPGFTCYGDRKVGKFEESREMNTQDRR